MNHSRGRVPKGAPVSGETQHSAERRKVARALQCSHVRQYNLILAFLLIACFVSVHPCGAVCSMKIY